MFTFIDDNISGRCAASAGTLADHIHVLATDGDGWFNTQFSQCSSRNCVHHFSSGLETKVGESLKRLDYDVLHVSVKGSGSSLPGMRFLSPDQ